MNRALTAEVAPRPPTRTVTYEGTGTWAGWRCTARADFTAAQLGELQSGQIHAVIAVLDTIVTDHNFPTTDGTRADSMGAVDPYGGLIAAGIGIFDAIRKLPNR